MRHAAARTSAEDSRQDQLRAGAEQALETPGRAPAGEDPLSTEMANPTDLHARLNGVIRALVEVGLPLEKARREFERQYVVAALKADGGAIARAADRLGVHRNTLRNKICGLGIRPVDYGGRGRRQR